MTRNDAGEKHAEITVVDKVIGTGPPVEKTLIVRFLFWVVKTDETIVESNDKRGPVCFTPTKALQEINTHSGDDPYG